MEVAEEEFLEPPKDVIKDLVSWKKNWGAGRDHVLSSGGPTGGENKVGGTGQPQK